MQSGPSVVLSVQSEICRSIKGKWRAGWKAKKKAESSSPGESWQHCLDNFVKQMSLTEAQSTFVTQGGN